MSARLVFQWSLHFNRQDTPSLSIMCWSGISRCRHSPTECLCQTARRAEARCSRSRTRAPPLPTPYRAGGLHLFGTGQLHPPRHDFCTHRLQVCKRAQHVSVFWIHLPLPCSAACRSSLTWKRSMAPVHGAQVQPRSATCFSLFRPRTFLIPARKLASQ